MRASLLATVSGLLFLLMAIASPQQTSAAGKHDGIYIGKFECYKVVPTSGGSVTYPVFGSEVHSNVKMTISDNRVVDQSGFFSGKINFLNNSVNLQVNVPKLGPHSIDGKFINVDGENLIKFEAGGEADAETSCEFYLTRSGAATGQVASKSTPKPIVIAASATQSASAAGKFDGEWNGKFFCIEVRYFAGTGDAMVEETEVNFPVALTISNGKPNGKFFPTENGSFRAELEPNGSIKIIGNHPKHGALKLEGALPDNEVGKERFVKLKGDLGDDRECEFYLTWSSTGTEQIAGGNIKYAAQKHVASKQSEQMQKAEAERQRLQQETAALEKQNKEAKLLVEAERIRQEVAKKLDEIERIRKEKEVHRLAEAKRKAEVKRVANIERKRKAEARNRAYEKRLAEVERKRNEEAKRLAESEGKRKAKAKRVAALEKKRKADEAKKRKAAQQTASASGGGGELRQQLAMLKRLRADGLINEQEFAAQKKALLVRYLGFKSAPSTKVARVVKPKNTELKKSLAKYSDVKFGTYHALVIGSNDYKYLPKLKTAKSDAKAVAKTLKSKYGYKVKTLLNATRIDILDAFDQYRETLTKTDNLLIYYAGHGYLDKKGDRGYWMPVDARPNRRSAWLSNADITDTLKALNAKHVMVMADSCYSGTLTRGLSIKERSPDYVREVVAKKARVVITSGGLEPVADKGGGNHSPFASVLLDVLNSNNGVLDGTKLFNKMRRPVMLKADQTPAYADVRKAGHEGGDFLFVRRR